MKIERLRELPLAQIQADQPLMHPSNPKLAELHVWYHFPISILDHRQVQDLPGWHLRVDPPKPAQATYFHPFIADALFKSDNDSVFRVWLRDQQPEQTWYPEFVDEIWKDGEKTGHHHKRFSVRPCKTELWTVNLNPDRGTHDGPGLAILAVEVAITGVATLDLPLYDPRALDGATYHGLTLHDAMDALEWLRRVFPRWRKDGPDKDGPNGPHMGRPGDSIVQVITSSGNRMQAHSAATDQAQFDKTGMMRLFPWIEALLHPLVLDGDKAKHLGDERAFMCSAIAIDGDGRAAFRAIPDGTLFRLAEADRAGDGGYNYNSAFLQELRAKYFYTRHAPGPYPVPCGQQDHGNTTLHLMSQHHLCALGTGDFAKTDMIRNMGQYYRYMQLLCVFEYFRLIQFSERLTKLIKDGANGGNKTQDFQTALFQIRKDFLHHTHMHHFTNVSSQLQAKEMFDRIYAVTELRDLHSAVEDELASAVDYAAMMDSRALAQQGQDLNNLVAIGVPAGLALSLAGIDEMTGKDGPAFFGLANLTAAPISGQILQFAVIFLGVFAAWLVLDRVRRGRGAVSRLAIGGLLVLALIAVVAAGYNWLHAPHLG